MAGHRRDTVYPGGRQHEQHRKPDFRIFAGPGTTEIGAAWTKQARDTGATYLSIKLDDPCFPAPMFASLHKADDRTPQPGVVPLNVANEAPGSGQAFIQPALHERTNYLVRLVRVRSLS
jgi:hypothetical protein